MAEKEDELRSVDAQIALVDAQIANVLERLGEVGRNLGELRRQRTELHQLRQKLCPHQRVVRAESCPNRCDLWNYDDAGFGSTAPEVRMCEDCGFAGAADGWTDYIALFGDRVPVRTVAEDEFQRLYDLLPHFPS